MVPVPRNDELPIRDRRRSGPWLVVVRSEVGLVRKRLEDAWCVPAPVAFQGGRPLHCVAVFDGLGGIPHGQEAAWAAADHLGEALAQSTKPADVLPRLNNWVRHTQGATTAVVAILPSAPTEPATLLSVGDSAAYTLGESGAATLATPKDAAGASVVTDYLGNPELAGHVTQASLGRGATLLLCTDGVDGVADLARVTDVLRAPDLAAATDDLFAELLERGAPDNATVVVARRVA